MDGGTARAQAGEGWHAGEGRADRGFFRKIVNVRDRLRVLEQRINSHPKLDDQDRLQLQDYITRIYGSLTTFQLLFAEPGDRFVGSGSKDED